jgi:hypothetical protein
VDLGVRGSSPRGGTNQINRLLPLRRPAEHHRLLIGCAEDQAGRLLRARETNSGEWVRGVLLAGPLLLAADWLNGDANGCVRAHRELALFSPAPSRVNRADRDEHLAARQLHHHRSAASSCAPEAIDTWRGPPHDRDGCVRRRRRLRDRGSRHPALRARRGRAGIIAGAGAPSAHSGNFGSGRQDPLEPHRDGAPRRRKPTPPHTPRSKEGPCPK